MPRKNPSCCSNWKPNKACLPLQFYSCVNPVRMRAFPAALVVKLVDTPDLGSGAVRRGGSSPSWRTIRDIAKPPCGIKHKVAQTVPFFVIYVSHKMTVWHLYSFIFLVQISGYVSFRSSLQSWP